MANAAPKFASGRRAKFACPRCGEVTRYDASRYEWHTKTWVCRDCVDELPLDRKPIKYVIDAEALRHSRMPNELDLHSAHVDNAALSIYAWTGDVPPIATSYGDVTGVGAAFAAGSPDMAAAQDVVGYGLAVDIGSVDVLAPVGVSGFALASAAGTAVALTGTIASVAGVGFAASLGIVAGTGVAGGDVFGCAMAASAGQPGAEATTYGDSSGAGSSLALGAVLSGTAGDVPTVTMTASAGIPATAGRRDVSGVQMSAQVGEVTAWVTPNTWGSSTWGADGWGV